MNMKNPRSAITLKYLKNGDFLNKKRDPAVPSSFLKSDELFRLLVPTQLPLWVTSGSLFIRLNKTVWHFGQQLVNRDFTHNALFLSC